MSPDNQSKMMNERSFQVIALSSCEMITNRAGTLDGLKVCSEAGDGMISVLIWGFREKFRTERGRG